MKATDIVNGLIHFFNDIIGAVIPGLILLIGAYLTGVIPVELEGRAESLASSAGGALLVAVSYAVGHGLLSLNRVLMRPLSPIRGIKALIDRGKYDVSSPLAKIERGQAFKRFRDVVRTRYTSPSSESQSFLIDGLSFHDVRSIAMTIAPEAGELARRFMFISLLCYGVSIASGVLLVLLLLVHAGDWGQHIQGYLAASVVSFFLLYFRGIEFEHRALNVPFPVAIATLLMTQSSEEPSA